MSAVRSTRRPLAAALAALVLMAATAAPLQAAAAGSSAVNINTAGTAELEALPRIGPEVARRIVAYRETHGGFKSKAELLNVRGIGEKTFALLRDRITVGETGAGGS